MLRQGRKGGSLADRRKRAWVLLPVLSSGFTMAMVVEDPCFVLPRAKRML